MSADTRRIDAVHPLVMTRGPNQRVKSHRNSAQRREHGFRCWAVEMCGLLTLTSARPSEAPGFHCHCHLQCCERGHTVKTKIR